MRTVIFVLCLFLVFSVASPAQTIIPPGNISGTWTYSNSPYQVNGDITIPNDSTLIIEPGVRIEFQGHYALNVQGRLLAVGTHADSMITFTINDTTGFHNSDTTLGGWYGIRMIDLPQTNDTTKLIYCKIEYGKAVGSGWFWNAGGGICILHFDKVIISNCVITNCSAGGSGFAVGGALAAGWSDIQLINNIFSYNIADAGGAIHFYESDPTLINNIIENNSANNGGGIDIQIRSHPTLIGNEIINNHAFVSGGGVNIGGDSVYITLDSCTITANSAQWGAGIRSMSAELNIINSLFSENQAVIGGGGFHSDTSIVNIERSQFINNHSDVGGGIRLYKTKCSIINCSISENYAEHSAGFHAEMSQVEIDNSNFINNTAHIQGGGIRFFNTKLVIDNSNISDNHAEWGGGMGLFESEVEINGCLFQNNEGTVGGGGLTSNDGNITINGSDFIENRSDVGAGIRIYKCILKIQNCNIQENTANWGGGIQSDLCQLDLYNTKINSNVSVSNGAGLRLYNSDVKIDSCLFTQNDAGVDGGAIEYTVDTLNYAAKCNFTLEQSQVNNNNSAGRYAGLIINQLHSDSSLVDVKIDKCEFNYNTANAATALRFIGNVEDMLVSNTIFEGNYSATTGGIFGVASGGSGKIVNCLFAKNTPIAAITGANSDLDYINCTFANNTGTLSPAMYLRAGGKANLLNSIFWANGNKPIELATAGSAGCTLTVNYCDIENGLDSIRVSDSLSVVNWGVGNLSSYPLFVDSAGSNFHLLDFSPCIGAGVDSIQIGGIWHYSPSTDLEGHIRPDPTGSNPDLGAYEGSGPEEVLSNGGTVPDQFRLYQNFPNPFNPVTTIRYDIPKRSFVLLKVFNTLGQEIATLVDEKQEAGSYEVILDGSSASGKLPSGVYFYNFQAGVFNETKKLVLLK